MQLLHVDGVQLEIPQAGVGALHDVVIREHLVDAHPALRRPALVFRRNFGGDINPLAGFAYDPAHQLLAVPLAIRQSSIDEIQPKLDGAADGPQRLVIRAALPLATANTPGAITDLTDFEACPAQRAVFHRNHDTRQGLLYQNASERGR